MPQPLLGQTIMEALGRAAAKTPPPPTAMQKFGTFMKGPAGKAGIGGILVGLALGMLMRHLLSKKKASGGMFGGMPMPPGGVPTMPTYPQFPPWEYQWYPNAAAAAPASQAAGIPPLMPLMDLSGQGPLPGVGLGPPPSPAGLFPPGLP